MDMAYIHEFGMFFQIVGEGAFFSKGMPNFGDRLDENQINDVKNYIIHEAKVLKNNIKANDPTNSGIH